ncbi:proline-rich protein 11 isoform X1 [Python bivittatus]|uniref:Proline-rich protein 11 isoform X1 n=1 Tax=Python bivittatus TaxID=176946 RepID=A0A9F5JDN2_PYTBI|nr:proline-rich protein 11 isoform X1 [Python bivittatus]
MARVKRRCQKLRSKTKLSSKRKKCIEFPCSSVLPSEAFPPKSPVSLCSQRWPFCSWLLAFGDIIEALKHLLAAAVSWCWCCQRKVAQIFHILISAAFPSHTYLQELKELRGEVKNLERDLAKLQSILQEKAHFPRKPIERYSPMQNSGVGGMGRREALGLLQTTRLARSLRMYCQLLPQRHNTAPQDLYLCLCKSERFPHLLLLHLLHHHHRHQHHFVSKEVMQR